MTPKKLKPKLKKEEAAENLVYFIGLMHLAFVWLFLKAYMGVFESGWWFYKNNSDLLPSHFVHGAGLYINRDNGVIFGFYNTSHEVQLSNWTNFYDPDKIIEDEEAEAANPKLQFTESEQWPRRSLRQREEMVGEGASI